MRVKRLFDIFYRAGGFDRDVPRPESSKGIIYAVSTNWGQPQYYVPDGDGWREVSQAEAFAACCQPMDEALARQ